MAQAVEQPRGRSRLSRCPLPDPAYLRFRLETQYGTDRAPDPDDIVTYLHWCHMT